jgi:hypothetical protein
MKTAIDTTRDRHSLRAVILGAVLLLCACAPNPIDVRSVLTISKDETKECGITVDGVAVEWDSNGQFIIDTANGGDYEILCADAPEGTRFKAFSVGVESISELVSANPLRIHVHKTSVKIIPRFEEENAAAAAPSVMPQERSRLPDGIILP